MKKINIALKLIIALIILTVIALFGYQNRAFFLTANSLSLDLNKFYINYSYHTPELFNAIFFMACLIIGFLSSSFFSLLSKFKSKRTIKKLNTDIKTHLNSIASLKAELESINNQSTINESISDQEPNDTTSESNNQQANP